ncbi:MAG: hypothetical protein IKH86_02900 [Prevotella sp.]|nr:hypothetical protein [Prevotella sp.]
MIIQKVFTGIGAALQKLFDKIKQIVVTIIKGVLQFLRDVVNWFKKLRLNPEEQTPFIVESERLREMIHNAPVVDVGIFEGVYNEETDEIEHYREISAESLDQKTRSVLANANDENPIVVLS